VNRRAFLGGATAGAALWALSCHNRPAPIVAAVEQRGEVRGWLHDAVARLSAAFPQARVHALATTRQRVTAAVDVLGEGVARARVDGVVISVRDAAGWREQVSSTLSRDGVIAAAAALAGKLGSPRAIDFGRPEVAPAPTGLDPHAVPDAKLVERTAAMLANDPDVSSRIVYTAAVLDVDDAHVWSVMADGLGHAGEAGGGVKAHHDREQRIVRVRRAVTRVAWNGTRPVVAEAARGWRGGLDDDALPIAAISQATDAALELMTPGVFTDGVRAVALEPSVAALMIDTATRALLTGAAARLPEVGHRLVAGATVGAPVLTLTDDPTAAGAYGGFAFDDDGVAAAPIVLLDRGKLAGRLDDAMTAASGSAGGRSRRPGHVGRSEPWPSHLALAPGDVPLDGLLGDGFRLAGGLAAVFDPSSDRIVVSVARAYEVKDGHRTGRVYADVELVGDLAELLAQVSAVASDRDTFPLRDEVDGLPRWRSIDTPGVITRALVRARRLP
jgi:predicted Zn-dependent protease